MKTRFTVLALVLNLLCLNSFAQAPLVYTAENTGGSCTAPPLPTLSQLPAIQPLPDPFMWANGSGRSTSFSDWECRRNEIKAQIENYEIGTKPTRPQNITASFNSTTKVLTVNVTVNGQTMTLNSQVVLPSGSGPFPAVIGMNSPSGSVPSTVFSGRNIAQITFSHDQVTTYNNPQNTDPYYRLYPNLNITNTGQYSAWAWGVSRIIDGLELVQASLPIDLKHIGVTGCSYAGKMALFAGAFDERVALTIAQESGGGGAPAWRVSETLGSVEKLGATSNQWFKDDMFTFAGANVAKLPEDHHELMAMVAPRALLVTGNTDFEWLANPAAYVSARATHEVYKTFGLGDRFGFYIDGGHNHCAVPAAQVPVMQAFVDKFLAGITTANTTDVTVNPYPTMNYQRWYQWWGTGNPVLPPLPPEPLGKRIWMEAECEAVGSLWQTVADTAASGGKYLVVNGLNSTATAPTGANAAIVFSFVVDSAATYNINARLNCPTADDDSYWIKVDNGAFATVNGLGTTGWQWLKLTSAALNVGPHTFTVAYREDGAKLDKLLITTSPATITGKGATADNCKAAQTITFAALPTKLFGDADFALSATTSSGLPLTYLSSDPTVATVTNGMVQMLKAGTTTITAFQAGNAVYRSAAVNQVLTVTPVQIVVQYKDDDNSRPAGQDIKPTLRLDNQGTSAVDYGSLTARYWLTPENYSGLSTSIDWAALGTSQVHARYVPLAQPRQGAIGYVEYTFDANLGNLATGSTSGEIRSRFNNLAYGDLTENDDYSYRLNSWAYAPNDHITLYRNGRLVYGTEPAAVDPTTTLDVLVQNRNGYSRGNTISAYLNVRNTGNQPVNYADLKVRYWFSPEGTAAINSWVDWAQVGASNVSGQVGQKGSDMYFETSFAPSLGQLYPLSSTGDVRFRLAKSDWTNFVEDNDWSYRTPYDYALNSHVTVYYQGKLVYGTEPSTASASARGTGNVTTLAAPANQENLLEAYPNPMASATTVQFQAAQAGQALVQVYNPLGQLVATLYNGAVDDNRTYQVPFATQALANGLYECRLVLGSKILTQRLAISH